jgi:hypothetical protein
MNRSTRPGRPRLLLLSIAMLGLIVAWFVVGMGSAAAAPTDPTISLDELRTALEASPGGVPGYFKTVLQGSTISTVGCQILAVVDGANDDGSPLIMFQVTDPAVVKLGGIAEGMSGSPLYVSDGDKLAGAVSYGYYFTTDDLGLATPIDLMSSIEANYPLGAAGTSPLAGPTSLGLRQLPEPVAPRTQVRHLARPVKTDGRAIDRLVIARSVKAAASLSPAAGTAVMVPLDVVEVGGLPKDSQAFKALSARLEKRGVNVVFAGGAGAGSADFTTDLVGGASVAAVLASGDFWMAGVGTVTYADGSNVVAFGHPMLYYGPCGYGMANANVYGIWNDLEAPFKMVSLGAMRGTVTQDRLYGIAGTVSDTPIAAISVHAHASMKDTAPGVDATTTIPQWVAESPDWAPGIIADACYSPVWRATDSYNFAGYESTHFTMSVSDKDKVNYPITRDNVWDDTYDVGFMAGWDVYDVVDQLLWNPNGTAPATLGDIDFSAVLSPTHTRMEMVDFSIPGGLKTGPNTVHLVLRPYGETETRALDVTLTLPPKTATSGYVDVNGTGEYAGWGYYFDDTSTSSTGTLPTVQSIVDDINSQPKNDLVEIDFMPYDASPLAPNDGLVSTTTALTSGADWFAVGERYKRTPAMFLRPSRSVIVRHTSVRLRGYLSPWDAGGTKVAIYRGASATPRVVSVKTDANGRSSFSLLVRNIAKTTVFKAVWDGSDRYIGATTKCKVRVIHR